MASHMSLHKTLLETERAAYERVYGRIGSPSELLQLLLSHEHFAWLRPFSTLIVQIDEALASREPVSEEEGSALLGQVRLLLKSGDDQYRQALQQSPDSVMAHADVMRFLPAEAA